MAQRVVIVDDSVLNRRLLETLVSELDDVEVLSYGKSAEMLERASALGASLFIVDYRMPDPDGMAVLTALRAHEPTESTPVVMVTAAEEREVCYEALERGASDFLVRPIDPREFTRRIGNLLALERARADAALNLVRARTAARLHAKRLNMLWRAGTSNVSDDEYLHKLIDHAARALVEGRHFAAAIARLDGDEFVIEGANDVPDGGGRIFVGHRFPAGDTPNEIAGGGAGWQTRICAPFQVGPARYVVAFFSEAAPLEPFSDFDTAYVETIANLCSSRLAQRVQFERMRYNMEHDVLTATLSRTAIRARGFAAMRACERTAFLVLNIDQFRHVNDTLGQQTGDALLVEVAARLQRAATGEEAVGRLGGDTFGILLPNCANRDAAEAAARRFLQTFDYPFGTGDREDLERVSLGASIGIAVAPDDATDFEMLLARADAACYAAKDGGGHQFAFFDRRVEETFAHIRHLKDELLTALTLGQFRLYFQPHVDIATRRITGAEALIRWEHPERGIVEPYAFIPFAERHGLVSAIGAWVMHEAARLSSGWRRADPSFHVWFNLSAPELQDATLVPRLTALGLDLGGLGVEITETVAMQNVVETLNVMDALRAAGLLIALDDFGTGYSSLAQLKRLPIDVVKIDRAFIDGLPHDRHDAAIVDAVLSIAGNFGFTTLAEGIEQEAQADFLNAGGCMLGQGFLYARPLAVDEFEELLAESRALP